MIREPKKFSETETEQLNRELQARIELLTKIVELGELAASIKMRKGRTS